MLKKSEDEGLLGGFDTVEMLRLAHALVVVHHAGVVVHVTVPEIQNICCDNFRSFYNYDVTLWQEKLQNY